MSTTLPGERVRPIPDDFKDEINGSRPYSVILKCNRRPSRSRDNAQVFCIYDFEDKQKYYIAARRRIPRNNDDDVGRIERFLQRKFPGEYTTEEKKSRMATITSPPVKTTSAARSTLFATPTFKENTENSIMQAADTSMDIDSTLPTITEEPPKSKRRKKKKVTVTQ